VQEIEHLEVSHPLFSFESEIQERIVYGIIDPSLVYIVKLKYLDVIIKQTLYIAANPLFRY
jgi:hypothetical protein